MTTDDATLTPQAPEHQAAAPRRARWTTGLAAALLLVAGAGVGAGAYALDRNEAAAFDTALAATPITKAQEDSNPVAFKGKVEEIFGNKFVIEDAGGRALVETGRAGEGGKLVAAGETVTVQGRFENGFLHATGLQHADGSVKELRPLPPRPPHEHPPVPGREG